MEPVHPLMADLLEITAELNLVLDDGAVADIDMLVTTHESYRGPLTGTPELRLAAEALNVLVGTLQHGLGAASDPAAFAEMTDEEAWTLQFVEMRLILAFDFLLTIAKLMALDAVPIFGQAPVVRSLLEVTTLALEVLEPVDPVDDSGDAHARRHLFVARHFNLRIRRLRGIDRRLDSDSVQGFLQSHFSDSKLAAQGRKQEEKQRELYAWASANSLQRVTVQGAPKDNGVYILEAPPSFSGRVQNYFVRSESHEDLDGAILGAHQYERLSLISHGEPDSVEGNRTDSGGVGLRPSDYQIVMPTASLIDAVHCWQRVILGPGWEPPLAWRAVEALAVRRLMRIESASP